MSRGVSLSLLYVGIDGRANIRKMKIHVAMCGVFFLFTRSRLFVCVKWCVDSKVMCILSLLRVGVCDDGFYSRVRNGFLNCAGKMTKYNKNTYFWRPLHTRQKVIGRNFTDNTRIFMQFAVIRWMPLTLGATHFFEDKIYPKNKLKKRHQIRNHFSARFARTPNRC